MIDGGGGALLGALIAVGSMSSVLLPALALSSERLVASSPGRGAALGGTSGSGRGFGGKPFPGGAGAGDFESSSASASRRGRSATAGGAERPVPRAAGGGAGRFGRGAVGSPRSRKTRSP